MTRAEQKVEDLKKTVNEELKSSNKILNDRVDKLEKALIQLANVVRELKKVPE